MRGSRPHNPNADYQIIDGIYFYKESDSGYYLGNVSIPGRKHRYPMRAHVYVWISHNGEIPKGYHVHHKDENKANNDISNLELLSTKDHLSLHGLERAEQSRNNILNNVLPKAVKWHKSEASKQFHTDHYQKHTKEIWMKPITLKCDFCGNEYQTNYASKSHSHYCSNKCKSAARRASGVDNVEKICKICGKTYIANKYQRTSKCPVCSNNPKYHHPE